MLNGYSPVFTNAPESLYEMGAYAGGYSFVREFLFKIETGDQRNGYKKLERVLQFRPNPFMDTSKFIYRIATTFR